jgi:hypothetical protein
MPLYDFFFAKRRPPDQTIAKPVNATEAMPAIPPVVVEPDLAAIISPDNQDRYEWRLFEPPETDQDAVNNVIDSLRHHEDQPELGDDDDDLCL